MEPTKGTYLVLPDELRNELAKPFGEVLTEETLIKKLNTNDYTIMSVGDEVTKTLIRHNMEPKIAVFDLKTRRHELTDNILIGHYKQKEVISNPQAQITFDLWEALKEAIKNKKNTAIQVLGEEDLAALVCACLAPKGWALLFGIPLKGVDITIIDDSVRATAEGFLNRMKILKIS